MAEKRTTDGGTEWTEDGLVEKLVADPGQTPKVQTMSGYLGRSDRPGYWRLYLTPRLDEFVECREEDLVHSERLGAGADPLGTTMVWVNQDATLLHTRSTTGRAQADFLSGAITRDLLSSSIPGTGTEAGLWTIIIRISARICTKICPDTGPTTCVTCLVCAKP